MASDRGVYHPVFPQGLGDLRCRKHSDPLVERSERKYKIFLAPSKEQIFDILGRFEDFLFDNLGLQLNSKTAIMPFDAGPEFVGKRIWPDKIQMRRSSSLHMKQHLRYIMDHYRTGELDLDYCLSVIRSYLGYMEHCNCDALRKKVLDDFALVRHYADDQNITIPD